MRDPKRIDGFINSFEKLWKEKPDLRFFQLVSILSNKACMYKNTNDDFFIEDDITIKIINEIIEKE